ncbi:TIGR02452 family protein [Streptomyces sp. CBMA29]|uniref:TIGR02452 family protein n=1 Tax=Streptomyces sp. CBMA29 TaxID=1896314 RepID=UPI001661C78C|nr:TIGR02452 family protein [Streptomyces sp. CBMA29]MBD0737097.1 TIGR02452 family protein [Streptomyces sp. CBMA29]
MSARLRNIATENQRIAAEGGYDCPAGRYVPLGEAIAAAADGTRMYGPGPVAVPGEGAWGDGPVRCEVTPESSMEAAARLVAADTSGGPVAVLNFASARNPGGGYVKGAQAQEEALCRSSALYPCLLRAPGFYAHHRADTDVFYSDRVIHSPAVPVFRDDRGTLLDVPYAVGFLTSPAPNAGVIARTTPERTPLVGAALDARAERVLEVAAVHGYRRLVLGAWGCGVFMNDPARVAAAFARLLTGDGRFVGAFDQAVFAVLDRRADSPTRAAFAAAFPETAAKRP